jgi:phosphoenolpyruvate synthase/pyruvate phosphate dikinase
MNPFMKASIKGTWKLWRLTVTIRLLDPPLHEYNPREKASRNYCRKLENQPCRKSK